MAPKAHIYLVFALLALAGVSSSALAAPAGSRIPNQTKPVDDSKEPEGVLVSPNDDKAAKRNVVCNGLKDDAASCISQADSFERMAQAYSYLGHYMMTQSAYSHTAKEGSISLAQQQKAIVDCTTGGGICTPDKQRKLISALVQYNLGKSVKSMILQNNTNQENMKSVPLAPGARAVNSKKVTSGPTYTESFKLTPRNLSAATQFRPKSAADLNDMAKLGDAFKQDYLKFIDTYTTSKGRESWNIVSERSGPDGHHRWKLDAATGAPMLNRDRQFYDETSQDLDPVKKVVASYKKSITSPKFSVITEEQIKKETEAEKKRAARTASSRRPGSKAPAVAAAAAPTAKAGDIAVEDVDGLKFSQAGLGVPLVYDETLKRMRTEQETTAVIANKINTDIDELTKKKREIASASGKPIGQVNVQLSMENFDKYLDRIWPQTGIPNKIQSNNK